MLNSLTASIRADMSTQIIQRQYKYNMPRNTPLVTDPCSRYYQWICNIIISILDIGCYLLGHQSNDHITSQIGKDYVDLFYQSRKTNQFEILANILFRRRSWRLLAGGSNLTFKQKQRWIKPQIQLYRAVLRKCSRLNGRNQTIIVHFDYNRIKVAFTKSAFFPTNPHEQVYSALPNLTILAIWFAY